MVVVEPGDELVTPPVASAPVVPDGELVLPEVELEPMLPELESLPLVPGPPIELVLGLVPAVLLEPVPEPLPLVDGVDELVEPVAPVEPVVASRLLQALSERAATTAKVAAAH